ncbi:hypothetical protein ACFVDQ_32350 [Streptomyces sp. NPDC057684]
MASCSGSSRTGTAWLGIATRYDRTPQSYLAGMHLRASMIWINGLTRTTR